MTDTCGSRIVYVSQPEGIHPRFAHVCEREKGHKGYHATASGNPAWTRISGDDEGGLTVEKRTSDE